MTRLLVLGLGNVTCADDGVGVAALQEIERRYKPARGVRLLDGGTLGLSLLPELERAEAAILIDSIHAEGPPGTLVRLEQDEVADAAASRLSVHQLGVADLLAGASLLGRSPPRMVLWGAVPATVELRFGLSPAVAAAVPLLVAAVLREAAAMGKPFQEKRRVSASAGSDLHRFGL